MHNPQPPSTFEPGPHGPADRPRPGPGQESVWDYPRPPRLEPTAKEVRVEFAGVVIACSQRAFRVLEESHPPTYYIPAEDVRTDLLIPSLTASYCEWKGRARYFSLRVPKSSAGESSARTPTFAESRDVAWSYPEPLAGFKDIAGHFAFYASRVDACFVDGERVTPQPGGFYGGWVTSDVVGPFKGGPGTRAY